MANSHFARDLAEAIPLFREPHRPGWSLTMTLCPSPVSSPEEVIERALETLAERLKQHPEMNLAEFEANLDALSEGSERLPILPPKAATRAAIYGDHD